LLPSIELRGGRQPVLMRSLSRAVQHDTEGAGANAARMAALLLASAVLFGGQSVFLTFVQAIPQALGVIALAFGALHWRTLVATAGARAMLALAGATLALIVIQLVPLPYALWSALPGRAVGVAMLAAGPGGKPWHPLSQDPQATLQSAFMLLPATGMLVVGLMLDRAALRGLLLLLLALATLSLLFGWLQLIAGIDSSLYFYGDQRVLVSTGLFSNRNHQADLLSLGALAAGIALYFLAPTQERLRRHQFALACAAVILFGAGVAATGSRMGASLFVPGAVIAIALSLADRRPGRRVRHRLPLVALAAIVTIAIGWLLVGQPFERLSANQDLRYAIWPDAWYLARSLWPYGSGFGTFALAYQQVEGLGHVTPLLVNAAHDDYLQLLIEGGAAALALVAALLVWLGLQVRRLLRAPSGRAGWFALAGLTLLLIHSAVDYPLRTEGLSTIFILLCLVLNSASHTIPAMGDAAANADGIDRARHITEAEHRG
jgi:O-antigen ligase